MHETQKQAISLTLAQLPDELRLKPARENELEAFEVAFGALPADYRWFLSTCGGGVVGREHLDGIRELAGSQTKFHREFGPPLGWSMTDVLIIGWDGAGNPIALHKKSGKVLVEDHTFGGVQEVAPSFAAYLEHLLRRAA